MALSKDYRQDIDGLRAIAVLAVVLFHVERTWLPGGFVGVDIFFVISGFLITGIILRERDANNFKFSEFYRRRLLRIMPVMLTVVASTLLVGALVLLPNDLIDLAQSSVASVLSAANIYFTFYLDTSYFAEDSATVPLLHLWSLGVEEQYYLIWPALLLVTVHFAGRTGLAILAVIITFLSFMSAQLMIPEHAKFAYYMLPGRAGQLLLGGLVVLLLETRLWQSLEKNVAIIMAVWVTGLALTAGSIFFLTETMLYPGWNAVPVTLGAALMIAGGRRQHLLLAPLKWMPVRYIGWISYSLYLWHWPVLAFLIYLIPEPTIGLRVTALALMFVLSVLSFHFVEQPFRHSERGFGRVFLTRMIVPGAAILALCMGMLTSKGFWPIGGETYEAKLETMGSPQAPFEMPYVCQRADLTPEMLVNSACVIGERSDPATLLWGDSNAAHFVGALGVLSQKYEFAFRNIAHSSCPPLISGAESYVSANKKASCESSNQMVVSQLDKYDGVVLSAAWPSYWKQPGFSESFSETLQHFDQLRKPVVVIGVIPHFSEIDRRCGQKSIKVPLLNCSSASEADGHVARLINEQIETETEKYDLVEFYSFNDLICSDGLCSAYLENELVYYDSGHLSATGSIKLGELDANLRSTEVFGKLSKVALTERAPLPWSTSEQVNTSNTTKLADLVDGSARDDVSSWQFTGGGSAQLTEQGFIIADESTDSYGFFARRTLPTSSANELAKAKRLVINLEFVPAIGDGASPGLPLVRVQPIGEDGNGFDFVIDPDTAEVEYRGRARPGDASTSMFDKTIELTTSIELSDSKDLQVVIFPSAVMKNGGYYSTQPTGKLEVESFDAFLSD